MRQRSPSSSASDGSGDASIGIDVVTVTSPNALRAGRQTGQDGAGAVDRISSALGQREAR